jgi:GNAT superfamily N-acetyltransferase
MHIRHAHASEAPILSALAFESKAHWPYSSAQLDAWRDDLTIAPGMILSCPTCVAVAGTKIIGFFMLGPSSPHWVLEHFWVAPHSMGRGVGRALLTHAAEIAARAGSTALAIDADPYAEGFYIACGAERTGSLTAPIAGAPQRERPQLLLSTRA